MNSGAVAAVSRTGRSRLRRFARRAGFLSSALGVLLSMIVAAALMRLALWDADNVHRGDLGALLVSACQAALALGDRELLQDTLNELAPRLTDLTSAEALNTQGELLAGWQRSGTDGAGKPTKDSFAVLDAGGQVIGALHVTVSSERARKAIDQMWLLLGAIALVCLAGAWAASAVIGKEIDEKGRLEGELAAAERIQTALLPRRLSLPGVDLAASMLTADEVGGDYYDVIGNQHSGWICIGDAMGHGLPAGLTMLMLQSGIATLLRHQPEVEPRQVIQAINRMLYENSQLRLGEPSYATLVVAHCTEDGVLRFAGGHLDPILYRQATARSEVVPLEGPFVGLELDLEDGAIAQTTLSLEPGDLLVFYTDGLTEARNANGEMFGLERLRQTVDAAPTLPLEQLIERVLQECNAFASARRDDITMVALRRQPLGSTET
jgi:serine phosphatase RsbU (regulator of sigma subunit)